MFAAPHCFTSSTTASRVSTTPDATCFLSFIFFFSRVHASLRSGASLSSNGAGPRQGSLFHTTPLDGFLIFEDPHRGGGPPRALIRDLSFWERLVSQTLCRFVRRAASQWLHLSTKQRHRLFWIKIERYDPARETPVGPRVLPYTVWVSRKARPSPPARRTSHVHPLPALPFSSSSLQAIIPYAHKNDG